MIEGLNEGRIKVRLSQDLQRKLGAISDLWDCTPEHVVRELIRLADMPGEPQDAPGTLEDLQPTPDQHRRLIRG